MPPPYTTVFFTNRQPSQEVAVKLNKLRDDLSTAISGITPGTGDMTKAVYDTNNNGVVDTADSLAWSKLSGVPASFTPAAHAATHKSGGSDVIALDTLGATTDITTLNATTSAHGLLPKLSGTATTYLNGAGTFTTPAGAGDMTKAVYDTNNNGVVDTCDSLAWSKLTGVPGGLLFKSAAYNLLSTDNGVYVICTGGSWTLGLPASAVGLTYRARNDMGITGTTGTITITPASGTIDGVASLALLAGQEVLIMTDGSNWRTFGRQREVIIGTQDITASTASAFILLPPGYRYYDLAWENIAPVTTNQDLTLNVSSDGGTTWLAGSYQNNLIYNSSATAVANLWSNGVANSQITNLIQGGVHAGSVYLKLWPGNGTSYPHWKFEGWGLNGSAGYLGGLVGDGQWAGSVITANAVRYQMASGNILSSQLTVKGVV